MKKFLALIVLVFWSNAFAQYGGLIAGLEFSKPIFSDFPDAKPGFMLGVYHNGIINKDELNFQIEITLNNYREYNTNQFTSIEKPGSILIEKETSSYITLEAAALFEVREIFTKYFPSFLIGFSVGYCVDDNHSSIITGDVNEISPLVTDTEKSPLPILIGINTGLSYEFTPFILGIRYKLSKIILDDRNFMQDVFLVISLKI